MDTYRRFKEWDFVNKLRYKIQNDLKLYKEREIESTFLKIIEPNNNKNKIIGAGFNPG